MAFDVPAAVVAFLLALPTGTLVEYGLHRFVQHAPSAGDTRHRPEPES